MPETPATLLRRLEKVRLEYTGDAAARKLDLLKRLARARLPDAKAVLRLHEVVCFLRAYPDDAEVRAQVEAMARGFARRADLKAFADELIDSGIAGTETYYSFYARAAAWLAEKWPERLHVDWAEFGKEDLLYSRLSLIARWAETPGLDEGEGELRDWIARMKGPREGTARSSPAASLPSPATASCASTSTRSSI